jgi:hypothetical protein
VSVLAHHHNRKHELRIMDRREKAQGSPITPHAPMRHSDLTRDALQKTFIVATLASTLVGTFTASMGLWERVADRREQHRQKIRDTKQDDEIKKMKEQFEEAQKRADGRQQEIDRLKSGGGQGQGQIGWGGGGRDDVGNNFERDGMMIQRMYDQGYGRMGNRFAQGDGMSQSNMVPEVY